MGLPTMTVGSIETEPVLERPASWLHVTIVR
jgi:hypothetical protein